MRPWLLGAALCCAGCETAGLALGAFGSSLTRTPNYAAQAYQSRLDREERARQMNADRCLALLRLNLSEREAATYENESGRAECKRERASLLEAAASPKEVGTVLEIYAACIKSASETYDQSLQSLQSEHTALLERCDLQ